MPPRAAPTDVTGNNETMPSERPTPATATTRKPPAPVQRALEPPSVTARYACAAAMTAVLAVWARYSLVPESTAPQIGSPMHDYKVPLAFSLFYAVALLLLWHVTPRYLAPHVDLKIMLTETMVVYNAAQVGLNGWMVYRFVVAVLFRNHPFVGEMNLVTSGATYATWIHYTDKYLEFFDTFFMILRGKLNQVTFLHIYHHVSISWAWWLGFTLWPGGDCYFGALLNSFIHVMMYTHYTLKLFKIESPWKKYLTIAQIIQFATVIAYSIVSCYCIAINEHRKPQYFVALFVQVFEMSSLLVLFRNFYTRTYTKKKGQSKNRRAVDNDDRNSNFDSSTEIVLEQSSTDSDGSSVVEEKNKKDQ